MGRKRSDSKLDGQWMCGLGSILGIAPDIVHIVGASDLILWGQEEKEKTKGGNSSSQIWGQAETLEFKIMQGEPQT